MRKLKILHLIPTLGSGGAERMLSRITCHDSDNDHIIIIFKSLTKENVFYKLKKDNITLLSLKYSSIKDLISSAKLYSRYLELHSPDVIQTWMYHSNLFGGVLGYIKGYRNIVWNIRSAEVSFSEMKLTTLCLALIGAFFSYLIPKTIISCSNRAIKVHRNLLYHRKKFLYIPNGIDEKHILEKKYRSNKKPRIGFVARLDSQKNHSNFLKSLEYVHDRINFTLIGHNVGSINLLEYSTNCCSISLLDETDDIMHHYDEFDFLILPSIYGEAFPNVLIEAMSRGVVCIVSDVGDSFSIISSTGYKILSPNIPKNIASTINNAVLDFKVNQNQYNKKSSGAIDRVKVNFTISNIVLQYKEVWSDTLSKR